MTRRTPLIVAAVALCACTIAAAETAQTNPATRPVDVDVPLLKRMSKLLAGAKTVQTSYEHEMTVSAEGMRQQMITNLTLTVERPNRLALVVRSGLLGVTIVSDGKQLLRYFPLFHQYAVEDAPAEMPPLEDPFGAGGLPAPGPTGIASALLADDPYAVLIEGVLKVDDLGTEQLNGSAARHLRFTQEQYDWDLWLAAGEQPLPVQIRFDPTKFFKKMAEEEPVPRDLKVQVVVRFGPWKIDSKVPQDAFAFAPPADAKKVESLGPEMIGQEQPHPLLGVDSPVFTLKLLDGGQVNLADHKGKDIVILDFWATWCGPCVRALPLLAEVAAQYKDKGVVFYAVNQRESPDQIRGFLEDRNLDVPVLLDSDGAAGDMYGVEGIPQTVLIGKDGRVQDVHVGYSPSLKKQLSEKIDRLLAGEDLAAKRVAAHTAATQPAGVECIIVKEGRYVCVAAGSDGRMYAGTASGDVVQFDATGITLRSWRLKEPARSLHAAQLIEGGSDELLNFKVWGGTLKAYDAEGRLLWSYSPGGGIDDVWAADLDKDGTDEVIVGCNGRTGLHVLDNRGRMLWKDTSIGNVWHVCAAQVDETADLEVVTTSAEGRVHVFASDARKIKDISTPCYASMVRAGPEGLLLVGGLGDDGTQMIGVDPEGKVRWSVALTAGEGAFIDTASAAMSRPWCAVGLRGGQVLVVDTTEGRIVARAQVRGTRLDVAWCENGQEAPILFVATGRVINGYRITATELTKPSTRPAEPESAGS